MEENCETAQTPKKMFDFLCCQATPTRHKIPGLPRAAGKSKEADQATPSLTGHPAPGRSGPTLGRLPQVDPAALSRWTYLPCAVSTIIPSSRWRASRDLRSCFSPPVRASFLSWGSALAIEHQCTSTRPSAQWTTAWWSSSDWSSRQPS